MVASDDKHKHPDSSVLERLKLLLLITIWGIFGIIYNIYSKEALQKLPHPLSLGFFQLSVGSTIVLLTWAASPPPFPFKDMLQYTPIATCHLLGSIGTLISMNYSSVGFTHIVKAGEPIATAVFSYLLSSKVYSMATYGTLVLIVLGIALASANELKFSWASLISSTVAAIFYPLRIVFSKKVVLNPDTDMSGKTLFRIITVLTTILAVPLLAFDTLSGAGMITSLLDDSELIFLVFISGASFHIYSEVMFMILDNVSPLALAVINSSRRIAIIASSVVVFGSAMTSRGYLGCTVAIIGAFLFSISNIYYDNKNSST